MVMYRFRVVQCPIKLTQKKVEFWFEFCNIAMRSSVYCLTFCFEFHNHHIHKIKQKKHLYKRKKVIIRINSNPGPVITGFRTFLPCFQQINLTWTRDLIEIQHLVSGRLKKNAWLRWAADLSPRYGHVIPCFDRCQLIITGMSNIKEVHGEPRLYVSVQGGAEDSHRPGTFFCISIIQQKVTSQRLKIQLNSRLVGDEGWRLDW